MDWSGSGAPISDSHRRTSGAPNIKVTYPIPSPSRVFERTLLTISRRTSGVPPDGSQRGEPRKSHCILVHRRCASGASPSANFSLHTCNQSIVETRKSWCPSLLYRWGPEDSQNSNRSHTPQKRVLGHNPFRGGQENSGA